MQKEFENHEKTKNMTEEEKKKFETEQHEMEEKHKKHAPVCILNNIYCLQQLFQKSSVSFRFLFYSCIILSANHN